ncbi:hypothetical protein GCM10009665_34920 [Kitasatospora nipponensis]|uniref:TadE-like domain-containing protein n=1 Tax=Kitasatospora nipponensis TaxID=258049 RepID=A0ABN1WBC9_9ACTN
MFPIALLLVMLVVQAALLWYSDSVALAAAREGADAGRVAQGTDDAAKARAMAFLARFQDVVGTATVEVPPRKDGVFTMVVHVHPLLLIPWSDGLTLTQQVKEPIEQYVQPGQRAG